MDKEKNRKIEVTRRDFLVGAGTVAVGSAVGAGVLSGCGTVSTKVTAPATITTTPAREWSWTKVPDPIPDSRIKKTYTADIVVVGLGNAGHMALLTAAEGGASVIGVEQKAEGYGVCGDQMGLLSGTSFQKSQGIEFTDEDRRLAVWELMKLGGNRADGRFYRQWLENGNELFDWLKAITDEAGVTWSAMNAQPDWDNSIEQYRSYPTVAVCDNKGLFKAMKKKAVDLGATIQHKITAKQLIKSNGRVTGLIATNGDGDYVKYVAEKGVILCTGDYSGSTEMIEAYCPRILATGRTNGLQPLNKGAGHQMGMWVGAQMELGPHAPITHAMNYGLLGKAASLQINALGERFHNESVGGQAWNESVEQQPGTICWQVIDSNWEKYYMNSSEGIPQAPNDGPMGMMGMSVAEQLASASSIPVEERPPNYNDQFASMTPRAIYTADTLEGLAALMKVPAEKFVSEVRRYNQLCYKGNDSDFQKPPWRLFPVDTPPYYAGKAGLNCMLTLLGGLLTDPNTMQAYDKDFNIIKGLYLAGNTVGRRFNISYPEVCMGISVGMARVNGRCAAKQALLG